ncbi:hypothetical protein E2C01_061778 [Portunus trituberculatus]|uniref:Uncharacterized protein n=1 Tax=Portunus trituberculatus TaxID=210409 RepID=A0A5B7H4S3_PORTR|nr:hypothetical protein [Portunus trituberculatus]
MEEEDESQTRETHNTRKTKTCIGTRRKEVVKPELISSKPWIKPCQREGDTREELRRGEDNKAGTHGTATAGKKLET